MAKSIVTRRKKPNDAFAAGTIALADQFRRDVSGSWTDNRLEQASHYRGIIYIAIRALMDAILSSSIQINRKHRKYHTTSLRRQEKGQDAESYYLKAMDELGAKFVKSLESIKDFSADKFIEVSQSHASTMSKLEAAFHKALPTPNTNSQDEQFRPFDDPDHSLVKLIDIPNRTETFNELLAQIVLQYHLTGSGLLWGNPNNFGVPAELYVLPTALCYPQPADPQYPEGWWRVTQYYPSGGYGMLPSPLAGGGAPVDGRDIFVFKNPHPLWRWDAMSPLTAGAIQLDILESIDQARWTAMECGLTPDMVLLAPGVQQSHLDVYLERLKQTNIGKRNYRKVMAIGGDQGDAKFDVKFPSTSAKDMDFSSGWDQMTAFALSLFGVPKSVAGLATTGSYAELYAALKQFHTLTLRPLVSRLGVWLTRHLAHIWGDDLAIQLDLPTIDDQQLQETQLQTDLAHDGLTYNEYRAIRGRKPVVGGDVLCSVYVQQAQAKAQQAAQAAQPPQPGAAPPADGSAPPDQAGAAAAPDATGQPSSPNGASPPGTPDANAAPAPAAPDQSSGDPLAALLGTAQPGSDEGHAQNAVADAAMQSLGVPAEAAGGTVEKSLQSWLGKAMAPPSVFGRVLGKTKTKPVGTKTGTAPNAPDRTPATSDTLTKTQENNREPGEVYPAANGKPRQQTAEDTSAPAPEPKPTVAPPPAPKPVAAAPVQPAGISPTKPGSVTGPATSAPVPLPTQSGRPVAEGERWQGPTGRKFVLKNGRPVPTADPTPDQPNPTPAEPARPAPQRGPVPQQSVDWFHSLTPRQRSVIESSVTAAVQGKKFTPPAFLTNADEPHLANIIRAVNRETQGRIAAAPGASPINTASNVLGNVARFLRGRPLVSASAPPINLPDRLDTFHALHGATPTAQQPSSPNATPTAPANARAWLSTLSPHEEDLVNAAVADAASGKQTLRPRFLKREDAPHFDALVNAAKNATGPTNTASLIEKIAALPSSKKQGLSREILQGMHPDAVWQIAAGAGFVPAGSKASSSGATSPAPSPSQPGAPAAAPASAAVPTVQPNPELQVTPLPHDYGAADPNEAARWATSVPENERITAFKAAQLAVKLNRLPPGDPQRLQMANELENTLKPLSPRSRAGFRSIISGGRTVQPIAPHPELQATVSAGQLPPAEAFHAAAESLGPLVNISPAVQATMARVSDWAGQHAARLAPRVAKHFGIPLEAATRLAQHAIVSIANHAAEKYAATGQADTITGGISPQNANGQSPLTLQVNPRKAHARKIVNDLLTHMSGGHEIPPTQAAEGAVALEHMPQSEIIQSDNHADHNMTVSEVRTRNKLASLAQKAVAAGVAGAVGAGTSLDAANAAQFSPVTDQSLPAIVAPAPTRPGANTLLPPGSAGTGEPPVKPGFVRLYHGGHETDGGKRWVSPQRDYAEGYANKSGGQVHYADVPQNHPELQAATDYDAVAGTNMKPPVSSFEASPELSRQLKPIGSAGGPPSAPPGLHSPGLQSAPAADDANFFSPNGIPTASRRPQDEAPQPAPPAESAPAGAPPTPNLVSADQPAANNSVAAPPIHNPNVEEVGPHGITTAARVGVPANEVPDKIPRLPRLPERLREVETHFADEYEKNPDAMADRFTDLMKKAAAEKGGGPPEFGTDDAKRLSKHWSSPELDQNLEQRSKNRATLNLALHQTANAIAKRAFVRHLDTLKPGDKVMVTVGGVGAGKGYGLGKIPEAKALKAESKAIWDSAGDQNATENPWIQKELEKRGLKGVYVYTHVNPFKQWDDPGDPAKGIPPRGVVNRANDPKDGRMVDAHVFADSYALGAKNHQAFYEANQNNPNAQFVTIDNTDKPKLIDGIPPAALNINRHELARHALRRLRNSDAPEHVKHGGDLGSHIWGEPEAPMAVPKTQTTAEQARSLLTAIKNKQIAPATLRRQPPPARRRFPLPGRVNKSDEVDDADEQQAEPPTEG